LFLACVCGALYKTRSKGEIQKQKTKSKKAHEKALPHCPFCSFVFGVAIVGSMGYVQRQCQVVFARTPV